MWSFVAAIGFLAPTSSSTTPNRTSLFSNDHVIFSSSFNITSLLVPSDGRNIQVESSDIPSVFFTISSSHFEGGSCVYVLEDLAAYEILEGGRDCTADYSSDVNVYIGARDGLYKYDKDSLSAKKLGPFKDNIIQIQKANGTDAFYILTNEHKMFKLEKNGTVKTRLKHVVCATQFVLDTSNNVYFVQCGDLMIHVIKADGSVPGITALTDMEFEDIKLLRPAFIMDDSIPFFGDGTLYILFVNGTCEKKDFFISDKPTAFSVDAGLYLIAALDGKIYEHNVMEMLLKSMFGMGTHGPQSVSKIIMSVAGSTKDYVFGLYRHLLFGWYQS